MIVFYRNTILFMMIPDLYRRYFNKLTNEIRSTYGSGPPDPEDVAQHAFEKLNNQDNPSKINNPEGFLWICARNIIISQKRAEQVRSKSEEELKQRYFTYSNDVFDPERSIIADKLLDIIKSTLLSMPERRRQVFLYNRIHGLTPEKAGKMCGISRTAAIKHIAAASALITQAICEDNL